MRSVLRLCQFEMGISCIKAVHKQAFIQPTQLEPWFSSQVPLVFMAHSIHIQLLAFLLVINVQEVFAVGFLFSLTSTSGTFALGNTQCTDTLASDIKHELRLLLPHGVLPPETWQSIIQASDPFCKVSHHYLATTGCCLEGTVPVVLKHHPCCF